ncbi:GTPase-associated system all-helical protein GASH [Xanthomonas sp. 3307]|uniref:GTPase-associated system all-helical protein GASH n=1 Tax=Xanthomonas sp. 3307 TaxID=3035316 RepID=UPI0016197CDF|nr:GTPase-associated system all-helical protein GASH [Xanthomonas sp. 3307]MBB5942855.1 hypothetical protein [Xanthomonas sp. 3307]
MSNFDLADHYKAAGIIVLPEIFERRLKVFESLVDNVDPDKFPDLVRMCFDLSSLKQVDWFLEAFRSEDPSFSSVDNAREFAILAAAILRALILSGNAEAALIVLTSSFNGAREPYITTDVVQVALISLRNLSIADRKRARGALDTIKPPAKSNVASTASGALQAQPDWAVAGNLIKQVAEEGHTSLRGLSSQVRRVIQGLEHQILDLRQEVDILWWHIGGYSRVLDLAFAEISPGLAAVLCGIDMADMSLTAEGPFAAQSLMQRTLSNAGINLASSTNLKSVAEGLQVDKASLLELDVVIDKFPDIFPLLSALNIYFRAEGDAHWLHLYKKSVHLDPEAEVDLISLAVQAFRERSLLCAMARRT